MKRVALFAGAVVLALGTGGAALGEPPAADAAELTSLRTIMVQLEQDMRTITSAISREDWERVAGLAPAIADHEQPPAADKRRILAWLGPEMPAFKAWDNQVHDAAAAMGEAAGRADGEAVIEKFARVQQACLGCHRAFREPFVAHFRPTAE